MVTAPTTRAGAGSWTPAELGVLLQAVEPVPGPTPPAGAVTLGDRSVDVVPMAGPHGEHPRHASVVAAGRLVASLEGAIRSLGWEPRRDTIRDAVAGSVTLAATRRRPAIPLVLARHRVDRRLREGLPCGTGRVELAQVVDVVRGASTTHVWCALANGPMHDGAPAWQTPGRPLPEAEGIDLPWTRDPVLAVLTYEDDMPDQVAAGVAAHRAVVTAGLRGLRAEVHTELLEDPEARVAWGRRLDSRGGRVHALVHLHP